MCARAATRRVFRFAQGAIHQDLTQETIRVTVKLILDRHVGVASVDTLESDGLARCVRAAREIARHAPAPADVPPLPSRRHLSTDVDYVPSTARLTSSACVASLKHLFHLCRGAGAELAGSLVTGEDELAVVNSAGTACYAASTVAGAKLVTIYRALSGYASAVHRDIRKVDLEELLTRSLQQSLHRAEPVTVPVGTYAVILEPEAVAELVTWLGAIAFGAKSVEERTSCLAGRIGERLMARAVTIYDDGKEPSSLRLPFDFEGTPTRRVTLIDRGKAAGMVYDTMYGMRFGHPSTGHGMPPDEVEGPLPLHLAMAPGTMRVAELIRRCERGLYVPRFHYVNGLFNPREALMTGLTREGAFLIERGKLTRPVRTLRFTQSLLEAFSHVVGISKERRLVADPALEMGCALMPALSLATFRFTGRSDA